MVYFEQRIVLPTQVEQRLDYLLDILNTFNQKLPDLSQPIDFSAAVQALESVQSTSESLRYSLATVEPALANVQLVLSDVRIVLARVEYAVFRIDDFIHTVHMLGIFMALIFLFLVVLVVMNMVLCYLVWKRSNSGHQREKEAVKTE